MRASIILLGLSLLRLDASGQCSCGFDRSGDADTLTFYNSSNVGNAHYFWNFGDGTGTNDSDPIHVFPASGHYLVTLYGRDTVTHCHAYYEEWIDVVKPSSEACVPMITDSIFTDMGTDYIVISELSSNCGEYASSWTDGPSGGGPFGSWCYLGGGDWTPGLFIGRVEYSTHDSVQGYVPRAAYQITSPAWFDPDVNYADCSANFEVLTEYQQDSALLTFTSMSPTGIDTFFICGFGNTVLLVGHSVSYRYPYIPYGPESTWLVGHGNYSDECTTLAYQQVAVKNPYFPPWVSCAIATQPQPVAALVGGIAQFTIETQDGTTKQWQQDAGLGWQDLTNAGPYSGVHTDTLTVANVQNWWNNNQYRCVVSNDLSYCHNTSAPAALTIAVGMEEGTGDLFRVYPIPARDRLHAVFAPEMLGAIASIRDVQGRSIRSWVIKVPQTDLDLGDLADGIYLFEVQDGHSFQRIRFVKQ